MDSDLTGPRAKTTSRSIVHITTDRSFSFQSRQSPLLPPPTRRNELSFSSQSGPSERQSSPIGCKVGYQRAGIEGEAGPSRSTVPMQSSTGWSDDEDDFDGIEDAIPTQTIPDGKNKGIAREGVTLDDLFEDEAEEQEGARVERRPASSGSGIRKLSPQP